MDVWVGRAYRKRDCINCTHQIELGDPVTIMQWKRTYPWGTRTKRVVSHWSCWVTKQEVYIDDHPYEPRQAAGPGRPVKYTGKQMTRRRGLLQNIKRWRTKQIDFIGDGLWATADRYKYKISVARDELNGM
jgi:hypothetical protein